MDVFPNIICDDFVILGTLRMLFLLSFSTNQFPKNLDTFENYLFSSYADRELQIYVFLWSF